MDAVLLSAYVQMKRARRGLDLGTGNGIIPILLSDRTDCAHLTGLEIQPALRRFLQVIYYALITENLLQNLDPRAIARHELLCTFEDVARAAAKLLRPGGHFYLVHRPMRLPELITTLCSKGLEPKRMRLVYPHADQAPNMVLLDCVRGGAPELRVEPPLIVYEKDGSYTPELLHIYYE